MNGDSSVVRVARCPKCGNVYSARPALSREDGVGYICPDCGVREALESIGCGPDAQEYILDLIHNYTEGKRKNV